MGYRYLPHTADLKAILEAGDRDSLFAEALRLVRDALVGDSPVVAKTTRELHLATDEADERFFRFVRELLYLYDSEGFLPASVDLGEPLQLSGEAFDPERHHSERQIKALTRHEFAIVETDRGCRATLLFDL